MSEHDVWCVSCYITCLFGACVVSSLFFNLGCGCAGIFPIHAVTTLPPTSHAPHSCSHHPPTNLPCHVLHPHTQLGNYEPSTLSYSYLNYAVSINIFCLSASLSSLPCEIVLVMPPSRGHQSGSRGGAQTGILSLTWQGKSLGGGYENINLGYSQDQCCS